MNKTALRIHPPLGDDQLQSRWADVNARFFRGALPSITIEWSRRLTSSVGLFSSRVGPRSQVPASFSKVPRRLIRLSLPLLSRLAEASPYAEQEILNTLAHEMIHQWQYDILKRRPDHGLEFLRKMTEMNQSGLVGITLYHGLEEQVRAIARYQWRCQQCGRDYHRTRRTIQENRHRCGACRGQLEPVDGQSGARRSADAWTPATQLPLTFERF